MDGTGWNILQRSILKKLQTEAILLRRIQRTVIPLPPEKKPVFRATVRPKSGLD